MRRALLLLVAVLGASLAVYSIAAAQTRQLSGDAAAPPGDAAQRGAALFAESCRSCHGADLRGVRNRGPSLRGVGAAAVDFYVATGRMPLARPGIEPQRADRSFSPAQTSDLIAWITSVDPTGPAIPTVDPARGDLSRGQQLFATNCSGCHQIVGRGGVGPGLVAPPLTKSSAVQVAEAIRVGPYLMPRFTPAQLPPSDVDALARYVTQVVHHPQNRGGWSIGNIGPVPEGIVAFLIAAFGLALVARIVGERT